MRVPVGVFPAALVLLAITGPVLADHFDDQHFGKIGKPIVGYKGGKPGKPDYSYAYGIKDQYSGVNVDVKETRKGDKTEGQYITQLSDGRKQKVSYYVDGKSGFVADVKYDGVAHHPILSKKPVKPYKYASLKPDKPIVVQHKPIVVPHKPIVVPHKPKPVLPYRPQPYGSPPVDIQFDFDDDDSYASYNQGFPKSAPFESYLKPDVYPPKKAYSQYGAAHDPYAQSSKLFQQQFYN